MNTDDNLLTDKKDFRSILILIQLIWAGLLILVNYLYIPNIVLTKLESRLYIICVIFVIQSVWFFWSWHKLTGTLFDPYIIFLTSAIFFNGGHLILEALHLNSTGILAQKFTVDVLLQTAYLVMTSLTCFHLGGLIVAYRFSNKEKRESKTPVIQPNFAPRPIDLRTLGLLLLAVSIVFLVQDLSTKMAVRNTVNYGGIYQMNVATGLRSYPRILAQFFIPACLFLLAGSQQHRTTRFFASVMVMIYTVIMFYLGYRGWNILFLVAYIWLYHKIIQPIPKMLFIGGAVLLLFLLPVVRELRSLSSSDVRQAINSYQSFNDLIQDPYDLVYEAGGSMQTVSYTLQLVPYQRDFEHGMTYLYAASTLVPNFFSEGIHPGKEKGALSDWLTKTVAPYTYTRGGGLGYSFIAEAYLNFGWWGTSLVLFIFGLIISWLSSWANTSKNLITLLVTSLFWAYFPFIARADTTTVLRLLIWYGALPYIASLVFTSITHKLSPPNTGHV